MYPKTKCNFILSDYTLMQEVNERNSSVRPGNLEYVPWVKK